MRKFDVFTAEGEKIASVFGAEMRDNEKSFVILDKDGNCLLVAPNTCLIIDSESKEQTISDKVRNAKLAISELEDFTGFTRNIIDNIRKIIKW